MAEVVLDVGPGIADPYIKNADSRKKFETVTGMTGKAVEAIKKVDQ